MVTGAKPRVRLVSDGACSGNPGPGGWACLLSLGEHRKALCGGERDTTNNRMELTALLQGLLALKKPCRVHVVSDSKYVIDAFEQGWLANWQAKGWKKVKNVDLWQAIMDAARPHELSFEWVRGHAGHPENELADALAVQARDQAALLPAPSPSPSQNGLF